MVEKIITLENIPLIDFLGVENQYINLISVAFPKSKIVSRGNQIIIKGSSPELITLNGIIQSLVTHYHKYGEITEESVEMYLNKEEDKLVLLKKAIFLYGTQGLKIAPKSKNQQQLISSSAKNDLVFAVGPAGTGKTYVAVALAVKALKDRAVKRIIFTRPAVEAGESLGFLPGDLKEKIDPYLRPIYDALHDMIPAEKLRYYMENGVIEIAPLAYMRGRTLSDAFVLLDEAQNTTPMQMKMCLTRMGLRSKMIITGDLSQIDLPHRQTSGLIISLNLLKKVKGIGVVHLDGKDVMRHRLVRSIIEAYGEDEKNNQR